MYRCSILHTERKMIVERVIVICVRCSGIIQNFFQYIENTHVCYIKYLLKNFYISAEKNLKMQLLFTVL